MKQIPTSIEKWGCRDKNVPFPSSARCDNIHGIRFRAHLELAGRFSPLVRRFEDFGGILKV